ncbi:MAG: FG-GAP repeat protein [Proteobacteria bacterium]|nr:FG-GAP repeat protein [Pseudomonadota bacterium]
MAQINGDGFANTLSGDIDSNIDDTLYGLAGNDTLMGLTGDDLLDGGSGNDSLVGGSGNDTYVVDSTGDVVTEELGAGDDLVRSTVSYSLTDNVENLTLMGTAQRGTGNALANSIIGNGSGNVLDGGAGDDFLQGGAGNDTYYVDSAFDEVVELASQGTDQVYSTVSYALADNIERLTLQGAAHISATGNILANSLTGNSGANLLDGGDGNDTLDGGAGLDTLVGGNGNDTYIIDDAREIVVTSADAGTDAVRASVDYTLGANQENLTLTGLAVVGIGNGTANVITGNTLANVLAGGDGNDTLNGGAGVDALAGGNGNDIYVIDDAREIDVASADAGTDLVKSAVDYTLGINQENLTLVGSAVSGTGNSGNNSITGNALNNVLSSGGGNDTLSGGLGADTMTGGSGNDTMVVDNSGDIVVEIAGGGTDTVKASISYTLGANVENLTLTGTLAIDGAGNLGNNIITGNAAANVLYGGGGGVDALIGGAGNDTYLVDAANITLTETSTGGIDLVRSSINFTLGNYLENLTLEGSAGSGTGNAMANIITGNAAANMLDGKAGADTLLGAGGDDVLVYDAADTLISGGSGNDSLRVATPLTTLDLTTLTNVGGIERLDVSGSGTTVRVSSAAIRALSDSAYLAIDGDVGSSVASTDTWNYLGTVGDYARYQLDGATLDIALAVARDAVAVVPASLAIAFSSADVVSFAENGSDAVIDANALHTELPSQLLTYSISGGADASLFTIDSATGVVRFVAAPDFEAPQDSNADNVYQLQIMASDGIVSSEQSLGITVTDANDAPLLDSSATPTLASVNAGSAAPSGAVGTLVASLVDPVGGGGVNNVLDADGTPLGLALTAANASNGTWWFSLNNGGSWSTVGAVSDTSALLLSASSARLYFHPNAGFSGTIANAITFRAWDTSSGTAGAKVTTAGAGTGTSAFSATSDTASELVAVVASVKDTIAVNTLNGTAGLKLNGVRGSLSPGFADGAGDSVAAAGDVNGDGRADLIVGANAAELLTDSQALNRGRAYVIFGDTSANLATLANGTTGFNLNLLNGTQGAALTGASEVNGGFSYMLAGGGDHNGDGLADLLSSQQNGSGASSRGYVVYGDTGTNGTGAGSFGNLNNLVASQLAGSNTSGVNDVNGDGMDDGAVFDGLDGRSLGLAIGNARDVDNDGVDDILIGNAERDTARGTDSGETFLVFGNSSSGLDGLAALGGANGTNVLSFRGQAAADNAGLEVTGIGDIDHDGFDDFLMGATKTGTDGKFYVVLGDTRANLATLSSSVNASGFNTALNGANGFRSINTPFAAVVNADAGHHVSAVGDFNGDLIDDFVVSVDGVGMALVVFGKSTGFSATLDLTTLMTTHVGGFGIAAGVNDVAGAGDVNGDGLADLIIGNAAANQAYILFGTSNVAPMIRTVDAYGVDLVDLTDNLSLSGSEVNLQSGGYLHGKGVVLNGVASTNFGTSVSGVGDFNGDGFDDVMVGAPLASATTAIGNPAGAAFVVYGADFAQAGTAAVNSTATAASQVLRGAAGVDHLSSGGFANVGISAGNGNDVIRVHGNEFGVNGGGGVDMLTPDTNNLSLNFDALVNKNLYANIEQIQLDGFGTNSVQLDLRDVLDMNGIQSELLITGDNGVDSVLSTGQGWSLSGTTVRNVFIDSTSSSANLTFNVYSHAGMHGSLLVEQDLAQTIS